MKTKAIFFLLFGILTTAGCKKSNLPPSIRFIEPENNILIEHDTILTLFVSAHDEDGAIQKVAFLINGTFVKGIETPPYRYEWEDLKIENEGIHLIKAVAYDDEGLSRAAELTIEVRDYRTKYIGTFSFKIITESWSIAAPPVFDTSYYIGAVRKYEPNDSQNDLFYDDDSGENPDRKITIAFKNNRKITSLLNIDGSLVPKSGYHYHHEGGYTDTNSINFIVVGLGGLGGGVNYQVEGKRE